MKCFPTNNRESAYTRIYRIGFNAFPAYHCSGGRVRFIARDWKEIHVSIKRHLTTRNYVGTVFGGSSFGALDPMYMIMLIKNLGPDYVVWDKSAQVKFIRPIVKRVCARFLIDDKLLSDIRETVAREKEMTLTLPVWFEDKAGKKYVEMDKKLYIADKAHYKEKRKRKTKNS
jgi:acyl-coenzyme A thioesterase PaaI-like protein